MTRRNLWKTVLVLVLAAAAAAIAFGDDHPGWRVAAYVVLALLAAGFLFIALMDRRMIQADQRAAHAFLARMRAAEQNRG